MIKTILITGGSGLIGKQLTEMLLCKGYKIHLLTRSGASINRPHVKAFKWDVYKREIDEKCISGVDAVIHLAGEGIADKRWTDDRKHQIRESRTESIRMIYDLIKKTKNQVNHIISASAIGFYGDRADEMLREESLPAKDFLAETCIEWESAVDEGIKLGLRVVKLRTGIILDAKGGALAQMAKPLKIGFGAILGSGIQWMSWIHIQDALRMYLFALKNQQMEGVYNMVAPSPVTTSEVTRAIAAAMGKSLLFFHIPEFALKLAMGEMSMLVLSSIRASAGKIKQAGFKFEYSTIDDALNEIYSSKVKSVISGAL